MHWGSQYKTTNQLARKYSEAAKRAGGLEAIDNLSFMLKWSNALVKSVEMINSFPIREDKRESENI